VGHMSEQGGTMNQHAEAALRLQGHL
jgi:hypothetical protein